MDTTENKKPKTTDSVLDPQVWHLLRVVRLQGDFVVLLLSAFLISLYVAVTDFKLPNQTASAVPPPFELSSVQTVQYVYQNGKLLRDGDTVNTSKVQVLGQVFDYGVIKNSWPNHTFTLNGEIVPLNQETGAYSVDYELKPGSNVLETAMRIDNQEYDPQSILLIFDPSYRPETKPEPAQD